MPYCPKCGKEISSGAKYCPKCGANLEEAKLEKIAEERGEKRADLRNCVISGLTMIAFGFFFWIIAAWLSAISTTRTEWKWGIIPKTVTYHPFAGAAELAVIGGVVLVILGAIIAFYCAYEREKLMK